MRLATKPSQIAGIRADLADVASSFMAAGQVYGRASSPHDDHLEGLHHIGGHKKCVPATASGRLVTAGDLSSIQRRCVGEHEGRPASYRIELSEHLAS